MSQPARAAQRRGHDRSLAAARRPRWAGRGYPATMRARPHPGPDAVPPGAAEVLMMGTLPRSIPIPGSGPCCRPRGPHGCLSAPPADQDDPAPQTIPRRGRRRRDYLGEQQAWVRERSKLGPDETRGDCLPELGRDAQGNQCFVTSCYDQTLRKVQRRALDILSAHLDQLLLRPTPAATGSSTPRPRPFSTRAPRSTSSSDGPRVPVAGDYDAATLVTLASTAERENPAMTKIGWDGRQAQLDCRRDTLDLLQLDCCNDRILLNGYIRLRPGSVLRTGATPATAATTSGDLTRSHLPKICAWESAATEQLYDPAAAGSSTAPVTAS